MASLVALRASVSPPSEGVGAASLSSGADGLAPPGRPPIATGEAAPRLVAGVIAAMWLA